MSEVTMIKMVLVGYVCFMAGLALYHIIDFFRERKKIQDMFKRIGKGFPKITRKDQ